MDHLEAILRRLHSLERANKRLTRRVSTLENQVAVAPPCPGPTAFDSSIEVVCPTCKAKPFEPCVTASGSKPGTVLHYIHSPRGDLFRRAKRAKRKK